MCPLVEPHWFTDHNNDAIKHDVFTTIAFTAF